MTEEELLQWFPLIEWFSRKYHIPNITQEDLRQDLCITLVKCGNYYDPERRTKFNTYLTRSLRLEVSRLLNNKRAKMRYVDIEGMDFRGDFDVDTNVVAELTKDEHEVVKLLMKGYSFNRIEKLCGAEVVGNLRRRFE